MWWVIHMCRGFDPLFSLWQDRARSFWGIFSHPPTPKRSFVVLKLPILTEFDLLGPKFNFSLDLFGSNFQRPAAHPHHFSDRVPPPRVWHLSVTKLLPESVLNPMFNWTPPNLCITSENSLMTNEFQFQNPFFQCRRYENISNGLPKRRSSWCPMYPRMHPVKLTSGRDVLKV